MTASSGPVDMGELIERAHLLAEKFHGKISQASPGLDLYRKLMAEEDGGRGKIVTAEDTAVELGAPGQRSVKAVLHTREKNLVRDNQFSLIGPDFDQSTGTSRPYAQLILLAIDKTASLDPWSLESLQYFPGVLPGLMARMVPGRLWLRASRDAVAAGLNFSIMAAAIRNAGFGQLPQLLGVESIFVTGSREEVEPFEGLASEAKILAGVHQRIAVGKNGDYECEELNCGNCEEKPVCDMIREVKAIRRRTERDLKA